MKLPRKLKKEIKKGVFVRFDNIEFLPKIKETETTRSVRFNTAPTFKGSNTKSFRRLCKLYRKAFYKGSKNLNN